MSWIGEVSGICLREGEDRRKRVPERWKKIK
jgi:hypothetical protein